MTAPAVAPAPLITHPDVRPDREEPLRLVVLEPGSTQPVHGTYDFIPEEPPRRRAEAKRLASIVLSPELKPTGTETPRGTALALGQRASHLTLVSDPRLN